MTPHWTPLESAAILAAYLVAGAVTLGVLDLLLTLYQRTGRWLRRRRR